MVLKQKYTLLCPRTSSSIRSEAALSLWYGINVCFSKFSALVCFLYHVTISVVYVEDVGEA